MILVCDKWGLGGTERLSHLPKVPQLVKWCHLDLNPGHLAPESVRLTLHGFSSATRRKPALSNNNNKYLLFIMLSQTPTHSSKP